jgi:hypothetical protein
LGIRRSDPGELGGSDRHGGGAKEAAAMMVDVFRHLDLVHG